MSITQLRRDKFENGIILYSFIGIVLIQPILLKFLGKARLGPGSYIDEIFYVIFIGLFLTKLSRLFKIKYYGLAVLFYFIYVLFGVFSAFNLPFSRNLTQIFLQVFLDLKFPIFISVYITLLMSDKLIQTFDKLFKIMVVASIPLCIFQLVAPGVYGSIFDKDVTEAMFDYGGVADLQRCAGIFWHPAQLAFFSGIAAFYFIYIKRNVVYCGAALLNLALSLQRQETATFFLLIVCVYVYATKNRKPLYFLVPFIVVLVVVYADNVIHYIDNFSSYVGLKYAGSATDARVVFYVSSVTLATKYFPMGVGFGNFGGFSAEMYNSSVYTAIGFNKYWWFKKDKFLTDTYYPHVLAEAGYFGLAFYCLFLLFLGLALLTLATDRRLKGAILFVYLFIVIVCLTAPAFNDPLDFTLVGVIIAMTRKDTIIINVLKNIKIITSRQAPLVTE
nr:O-antigen ligase family protein [uncultured Mucilaginibacter sp.]